MNNELLLMSGEDIPFIEAQITIHQPQMNEIALIGEENFLAGCKLLNISKDSIEKQDKPDLENKSDFEIFMSIMCRKEKIEYKNSVFMILALLFPQYKIKFTNREILLVSETNSTRINDENFNIFKDIISSMFCLSELDSVNKDYNPIDARAEKIAKKLRKHKERIAKHSGQTNKIAIFSRYISILATGLKKDINSLMKYTVFQLMDAHKRYQRKQSFDIYVQAKLAGAKDLEDVDNWMDDIHP